MCSLPVPKLKPSKCLIHVVTPRTGQSGWPALLVWVWGDKEIQTLNPSPRQKSSSQEAFHRRLRQLLAKGGVLARHPTKLVVSIGSFTNGNLLSTVAFNLTPQTFQALNPNRKRNSSTSDLNQSDTPKTPATIRGKAETSREVINLTSLPWQLGQVQASVYRQRLLFKRLGSGETGG